jgi:hypothetical protein
MGFRRDFETQGNYGRLQNVNVGINAIKEASRISYHEWQQLIGWTFGA